jgi:LCP family protein required for cell wall assembly
MSLGERYAHDPRFTDTHRDPRPAGNRITRCGTRRPPTGTARRRPSRRRGRHATVPRPRSGLVAALLALVLVGGAGIGGLALTAQHLTANLHTVALPGTGGDANATKSAAAPVAHAAVNLLLIGSDSRSNPADCAIGHDCGDGIDNADVELLVHLSADRSHVTAMSIPRDTVTELPECTDPTTGRRHRAHVGQINSALQYGPACSVAAVQALTGVSVDHFAMIDFVGVIAMSDAVGGVDVCVTDDVYDPYSHLRLTQGSHTLQGMAALQFVRSRHAFGDGSDLQRTYAQHLFLSAMIRAMTSAGTLANPVRVYSLADAATKALTVDTGLGSLAALAGTAKDLGTVPPSHITFATMPTGADPVDPNRVVPAERAQQVFQAIIDDKPLTTTSRSGASPTPAASPSGASSGAPPSGPSAGASGTTLSQAHAQTADAATGCAQVATLRTVALHGVGMTPTRAFELSPEVALSAP